MRIASRPCRGVNQTNGEPCRQPARKGEDYCRFHLPAAQEPIPSKRSQAQRGNSNARQHGGYSARLLPEELPLYEEKRTAFTAALGPVDVFDEQIVHILSLITVKIDAAMMRGADHAVYGGMVRQLLDLMKELKATRASREPVDTGRNLTYADLFARLKAHFGSEGSGVSLPTAVQVREQRVCVRCRQEGVHEQSITGAWRCSNCGLVTDMVVLGTEDDS